MTILYATYGRHADLLKYLEPTPAPGILRLEAPMELNLGCEVIVDVSFEESRLHVLLSGYVSRIAEEPQRESGAWEISVVFFERESHKLRYLSELASTVRPIDSTVEKRSSRRLPVRLQCRWRLRKDGTWQHALVEDIGLGGVFAQTAQPPPIGQRLTLELEIPGIESAVPIAGRVVRVQQTLARRGMGIQFVWRDRGGLVRLREILRRIEKPLSEELLSGIGAPESDFDEREDTLVESVERD